MDCSTASFSKTANALLGRNAAPSATGIDLSLPLPHPPAAFGPSTPDLIVDGPLPRFFAALALLIRQSERLISATISYLLTKLIIALWARARVDCLANRTRRLPAQAIAKENLSIRSAAARGGSA